MVKPLYEIIATRYLVAILASVGVGILYGLKVNLSVAMVRMINHTATSDQSAGNVTAQIGECPDSENDNSTEEDGPFLWSKTVQGALLSSYFWGYIISMYPGGRCAELLSVTWVLFFAVALNVVCTILTPMAAKWHYGAVLVVRILEGIGGGVSFPAIHVIIAHWSPPAERSTISSIAYSGTSLGTVIFSMVAGVIASALGWEAIFYIQGAASAAWLPFWFFFVHDSPQKQKYISEKEREMITQSLHSGSEDQEQQAKAQLKLPWKSILTSRPLLAITVAHVCSNWGWYLVLIQLPLYLKTVLKFKIAANGILTAIPYFSMWIFSMILSKVLDTLQVSGKLSTTWARKIATLIASVIPGACFFALIFVGCDTKLVIVLMTIITTAAGAMFSGFLANHIDIAPNFAGSLMSFTNTFATISGILVPIFVARMTQKHATVTAWNKVFYVTVSLYVVEIIVYTLFGSGVEQSWNRPK